VATYQYEDSVYYKWPRRDWSLNDLGLKKSEFETSITGVLIFDSGSRENGSILNILVDLEIDKVIKKQDIKHTVVNKIELSRHSKSNCRKNMAF
jgi:hypothetical protein